MQANFRTQSDRWESLMGPMNIWYVLIEINSIHWHKITLWSFEHWSIFFCFCLTVYSIMLNAIYMRRKERVKLHKFRQSLWHGYAVQYTDQYIVAWNLWFTVECEELFSVHFVGGRVVTLPERIGHPLLCLCELWCTIYSTVQCSAVQCSWMLFVVYTKVYSWVHSTL